MKDWSLQSVTNWLFTTGRLIEGETAFVQQLAHQLNACGAPVDRLHVTIRTLNPRVVGTTVRWQKSTDAPQRVQPEHHVRQSDSFIGSPMQQLFESRQLLRQRLDQLPADAHSVFTGLAENGYLDYAGFPIITSDGMISSFIIATKSEQGFSETDIEKFGELINYLAPVLEVHSLRILSKSLLNTYVGERTAEKVLSGMIKRGDADVISAALWFSDLRGFTHLSETLPADQVLDLLNNYFEFVSASVTARGGEILRFIGDAMLIVFPIDQEVDRVSACTAAIDAALDAQNTLASLNHRRRRHGLPTIEFGVGLNVGEVVYGNVGAPDRLDFTVMGPAVNRTARLESMTKDLKVSILFSREFSQLIPYSVTSHGLKQMKGIEAEQEVFSLKE